MNLRIARKIVKAVGTPDESRYSEFQIGKAVARVSRTRSYKDDFAFVQGIFNEMTPLQRANILKRHDVSLAFDLLMRTPVNAWTRPTIQPPTPPPPSIDSYIQRN